ncbi:MAG: peptidylprolyl isomerase [Trueperaceae bacterium]
MTVNKPLLRLLFTLLTAFALVTTAAAQGADTGSAPTAPETAATQDDPVVLQVGATTERASEIEWRFEVAIRNIVAQQGMPFSPEVALQLRGLLPTYLEQRAQEVALVVEAQRRGITPNEEAIQADLDGIRSSAETEEEFLALIGSAGFSSEDQIRGMLVEADIVNQLVQQLRAQAEEGVTDATLRTRYLADRESFRQSEAFCARHILVAEEELAQQLLDRLEAGEEFADLAAEYGTDGTRTRGGDLGCFGRGAMVADFEQAVLDAEVGTPSGPVATQFGFHVVLVYDHTPARVAPFDEVKDEVRSYVVGLATEAAIDGIIEGSGARTYPERLAPVAP